MAAAALRTQARFRRLAAEGTAWVIRAAGPTWRSTTTVSHQGGGGRPAAALSVTP
eukprot:SAG11_NODE_22033_length_413_cov_1.159236_1_plen_54_part_10